MLTEYPINFTFKINELLWNLRVLMFKERSNDLHFRGSLVEPKGFEPLTSALSKQRSKPAELRFRNYFALKSNFKVA
jgi:hypothetical protein